MRSSSVYHKGINSSMPFAAFPHSFPHLAKGRGCAPGHHGRSPRCAPMLTLIDFKTSCRKGLGKLTNPPSPFAFLSGKGGGYHEYRAARKHAAHLWGSSLLFPSAQGRWFFFVGGFQKVSNLPLGVTTTWVAVVPQKLRFAGGLRSRKMPTLGGSSGEMEEPPDQLPFL